MSARPSHPSGHQPNGGRDKAINAPEAAPRASEATNRLVGVESVPRKARMDFLSTREDPNSDTEPAGDT